MPTPLPATKTTIDTHGERCRDPHCRTRPEPGYAPRGLCQRHETEGLDAIRDLYTDWADLQPLVWDKQRGGLGAIGGKFGPSEPINYAAAALAGEIAYTAVVWEIAVRDRARLSEVNLDHWPTGDDLARAVRTLTAHYSVLIATPITDQMDYDDKPASADGIDAILALVALHRRARSMIGLSSRETTVPGMCSVRECGREDLRHRDGSNTVHCAGCRATWTWDEYQDAVALVPVARAA